MTDHHPHRSQHLLKALAQEAAIKANQDASSTSSSMVHRQRVLKRLATEAAAAATDKYIKYEKGLLKELAKEAAMAANEGDVLAAVAAAAANDLPPMSHHQRQKQLLLQQLKHTGNCSDGGGRSKDSSSPSSLSEEEEVGLNNNNKDAHQEQQQRQKQKHQPSSVLFELIRLQKWDDVVQRCMTHCADVMYISNCKLRWTPLHLICSIGSSPCCILQSIVQIWPGATTIQDKRYKDTPLHIQCRNSQRSLDKVSTILQYGSSCCGDGDDDNNDEDVGHENGSTTTTSRPAAITSIKNWGGKTPLHVACGSVAMLPVLQALLEADPSTLFVRDFDNATPLTNLWNSYIQTIPGQLAVARILTVGNKTPEQALGDDDNNHFDRFWDKIRYLALEAPQLLLAQQHTMKQQQQVKEEVEEKKNLGHVLLVQHGAPLNLVKVAIRCEPTIVMSPVDSVGNYLLHAALKHCSSSTMYHQQQNNSVVDGHYKASRKRSPSHFYYKDLIMLLLDDSASLCNKEGESPLNMFISIRRNFTWDDGINSLMHACPKMLDYQDPETKLYPFMLAAQNTANSFALDIIYELLLARPELVHLGVLNSRGGKIN